MRGLLELALAKGASREVLEARSGIDPAELKNQDNRIPFANYVALMRAAKELTNDPALALHYGEAVSIGELSIVGLVGRSGETPSEALALVNRYARLDFEVELDGADRLQFVQRHGRFWLVDNRRNASDFPELTESGFARMVCDARRLGIATPVREVHVTHAAPSYCAEYERIFQAPIVFESAWNALQLDDKLLTYRNAPQPRYLSGLLSERADALLGSLERSKSTGDHVERLLMPILHSGTGNIRTIAGQLGISRQALHSKLRAEGQTFEQVLDRLRHKLALLYVAERKVSVSEAAHLLGFSDRAAFSRAFKRWTGSSPGAMRAKRASEKNQPGH